MLGGGGGGGSVAFEVFYLYLVYNPDGIVLVRRYYVTCLNLYTDVRTDTPAEDVEHAGDVLVRRRWVCPPTSVHDMEYREKPAVRDQFLQDL